MHVKAGVAKVVQALHWCSLHESHGDRQLVPITDMDEKLSGNTAGQPVVR